MIELTYQPYDNPVTDFGWLLKACESTNYNGRLVWKTTVYRGASDNQAAALQDAENFARSIGATIVRYAETVHEC